MAFEDLGRFGSLDVNLAAGTATISGPSGVLFSYSLQSVDCIAGTNKPDVLTGDDGIDCIYGLAGADMLIGRNGNDTLYGEKGDDTLWGGVADTAGLLPSGDDNLDGGADNDFLFGNDGNDTLLGQSGRDILGGGDGNDVLFGGGGPDKLSGGEGDDELYGYDGRDEFAFGYIIDQQDNFNRTGGLIGNDTIMDFTADDKGFISRAGFDPAFASMSQSGSDTIITVAANGGGVFIGTITVKNVLPGQLTLQTDVNDYASGSPEAAISLQ